VLQSEAELSSSAIDACVRRSLACLRANFRTTSTGTAGWYHYLDDPQPGVTASAVGLYCFGLAGVEFERADQVVRYLISQQGSGEYEGGWAVRTTNNFPIVEATAWVLRCLAIQTSSLTTAGDALKKGVLWLENNQNTDFGWGSYKGQPSRTFTTALAVLALQECGGSADIISNAHKWLIEAQGQNQPAWGPLPMSEPTSLHTSIALLALLGSPGSLPVTAVRQTIDWLSERLQPGDHVERSTMVEEYDVPYLHNDIPDTFQNSLPHFAGPVALTALLRAGADPLQVNMFRAVNEIIRTQETGDSPRSGTWELPRSPLRPSIWAIWPFIAALTSARNAIFPSVDSMATLLFPGCTLIQSAAAPKHLTRRLLIKNALIDWIRQRKLAVGLWVTALAAIAVLLVLWQTKQLTMNIFLIALVLPVLLLIFQILWDRRTSTQEGAKDA
jgi:Squalene-hopene cyclase C-terminal domain